MSVRLQACYSAIHTGIGGDLEVSAATEAASLKGIACMPLEYGRLNRRSVHDFLNQLDAIVLHISYRSVYGPTSHLIRRKGLKKPLPIVVHCQPAKIMTVIDNRWHAVMNRFEQFVQRDGVTPLSAL